MSMPAGKYYVGDLCYVLTQQNEWDQFCDITISGNTCLSGEFSMPDGRRFATYTTEYGDGVYEDRQGRSYGVDAGLIGCILMTDIPHISEDQANELGAVIDFEANFITESVGGIIRFGQVIIDTSFPDEDDEDFSDAW